MKTIEKSVRAATAAVAVLVLASVLFAGTGAAATVMPQPVDGVITLTEDVDLSSRYEIEAGTTLTINLNGCNITYVGGTLLPSGVILVHNGAALTVNGPGAIDAGSKAYAAIALTKNGDDSSNVSKLTVNGGTYRGLYYAITGNGARPNTDITINDGIFTSDEGSAVYHPQKGKLTIKGGTFVGTVAVYVKSGDITISGGSFKGTLAPYRKPEYQGSGFDDSGDAVVIDNADYPGDNAHPVVVSGGTFEAVADGASGIAYYSTMETAKSRGITVTKEVAASTTINADARIGNRYYVTLDDAVSAAAGGDTVTLLRDLDLTGYVSSGGAPGHVFDFKDGVTLDLAGYEITSNNFGTVYQGNDLKITDGSFVAADGGSYALFVGDETPTDGVVLDNLACTGGINIYNTNVEIDQTKCTGVSGTKYYAIWCDANAHATVKGGTYTSASTDAGIVLSCEDTTGSWIHIEGGTFTATEPVEMFAPSTEKLITVSGGYFSDDSVKSHTVPGYFARESTILPDYYEVTTGSEPVIEVEPKLNPDGTTSIATAPKGNTEVIVDETKKTAILRDTITNVEITFTFGDDMVKGEDNVTGRVSSITATYPEMKAPREDVAFIPITLRLDLDTSLSGKIVLPIIDTEYNTPAAAAVDNPVATVTGLGNDNESIEDIDRHIISLTLTFRGVEAPGTGWKYVVYHVDSEGAPVKVSTAWEENEGGNLMFTSTLKFSSYVLAKEKVDQPEPELPAHGHNPSLPAEYYTSGYVEPMVQQTATPAATPTPAAPTMMPTAKPTQTQKSPVPLAGLVAGLGVAAVLLRRT